MKLDWKDDRKQQSVKRLQKVDVQTFRVTVKPLNKYQLFLTHP